MIFRLLWLGMGLQSNLLCVFFFLAVSVSDTFYSVVVSYSSCLPLPIRLFLIGQKVFGVFPHWCISFSIF